MTFDLVEHIHRHGFKRLLLAVSGGLDSICLAHYFIENREVLGIEWLGIAHVHHGLREGTADRDAKFVEEFAKSHNVPFFLKRLDGEALKAAEGSLEENARDARYKALVEIALDPSTSLHSAQDDTFLVSQPPYLTPHTSKQPKVATPYPAPHSSIAIVTAHHANDQAETMLMRIKRGTTLAGLRGIQSLRVLSNSRGVAGLASEAPLEGVMEDRATGCNQGESSPTQDDKNSRDPSTTNQRFSAQDDTILFSRLPTKQSLVSHSPYPMVRQAHQPILRLATDPIPHTPSLVSRLSSFVYLYRPFLHVTRAELLAYARENSLSWCEDESNADVKFARNKIRHELLPNLERECPGATKQLCRIAALADRAYAKVMEKCSRSFDFAQDDTTSFPFNTAQDDKPLVSRHWTQASLLSQPFGSAMPNFVGRVARPIWLSSLVSLDKKKLNKILREHAKADLSELFRLWLSELGFRFPTGFFYAPKEPAHIKIPIRASYRKRSIVKIRHTVWIYEFKDTESALKFVSCEMKEKGLYE